MRSEFVDVTCAIQKRVVGVQVKVGELGGHVLILVSFRSGCRVLKRRYQIWGQVVPISALGLLRLSFRIEAKKSASLPRSPTRMSEWLLHYCGRDLDFGDPFQRTVQQDCAPLNS